MKIFTKYLFFLLFVFVFVFTFTVYLLPFTVSAANAIPDPMVPCDETAFEDPEFNSLRPYQASPCGDSKKAFYCNNDYIINEKISTTWKAGCSLEDMTCPYSKIIERDYEIQMADVKLPILGNTQDVANSETGEDGFDDAQKMNEYLSWYLSGATQKAEYGLDSNDKLINYSGPIRKLVPSAIADFQRFSVLHDAGAKENFTLEAEGEADPVKSRETSNHNQIAVCTKPNLSIKIFGMPILLGSQMPIPCYDGSGNEANGEKVRLMEWWESKPADYLDSNKILEGRNPYLQAWDFKVPPFPWQFEKDVYYQKAYQEWRGKVCVLIPIIDKLACADPKINGIIDVKPNVWADLYQYIPLGVTADKAGGHSISGVSIKGGNNRTIVDRPRTASGDAQQGTYFIEQNPILYYPHTQNSYELLKLINTTQAPANSDGNIDTKTDPRNEASTPSDYEVGQCEIVDVRSNAGDDLTFDNGVIKNKQRVKITGVQIEVKQIGCENQGEIENYFKKCAGITATATGGTAGSATVTGTATGGTATSGSLGATTCNRPPSCDGTVIVTIPSTPKIPFADDIWSMSVVGQDSAFRRIFPKVGEGAPVSCIADIPAVSEVSYSPSGQTNLVGIDTPDGRKSPDNAQLFFPHLGTTYEYFLKGIQTALRPKGFGEPITNGSQCSISEVQCSKIADTYGVPSCLVDAILFLESGTTLQSQNQNVGTESCGNFKCCSAGVCGPAQIKCGLYGGLSAGQDIDLCDPCGAAELMSRLLLMKMCQAGGECGSYDWATMKTNAEKYKIKNVEDAATAACYYYGQNQGCSPTACTQYRWGSGISYGDAVKGICAGKPIQENKSMEYCVACSKEDPRVGMCAE